jgi:AraC-like DNA-binding protein
MVNLRSLLLVETELAKLDLRPTDIAMGEAEVQEDLTQNQHIELRIALRQSGLELLENRMDILVHRLRYAIVDIIYRDDPPEYNLSVYLSTTLGYDYTYMSNLFSDTLKITIEKFYICHKIERAKRLLLYEGLTLTEIAQKMHYSSPSHLSSQFKKVTGITPSQFKHENRHKHPLPADCG